MSWIGDQIKKVRRAAVEPGEELSRSQWALRFVYDLVRHCAQQLDRDQAGQMAAALTYRTIFSLVPVVVLMLLVFRAFGGFEHVQQDLEGRIYTYLGLSSITIQSVETPDPPVNQEDQKGEGQEDDAEERSTPEPADILDPTEEIDPEDGSDTDDADSEQVDTALRASIQMIISDLTKQASGTSFGSIGAVGLLLLIWGALALVITVEQSFNKIFKCSIGRPWHLRVPIYWAVLTLGPVLLLVSLYVAEAFVAYAESLVGYGVAEDGVDSSGKHVGLFGSIGGLAALGSSWLLLFISYMLLPNTRVRLRAALVGSLLAAILWESGKWAFKLYVTRAVSYSVLYGTLGLIPLFLLWVYLTWLIVLFGLEVTYTLQAMRGRVFEMEAAAVRAAEQTDPSWLIPIMSVIATGFSRGRSVTPQALALDMQQPVSAVERLTSVLESNGLIHRVQTKGDTEEAYALAKSPKLIPIAELISLQQSLSHAEHATQPGVQAATELLSELVESQKQAVGDRTLEDVITEIKTSPLAEHQPES